MYEHYKNGFYISDKGKVKRIRNNKEISVTIYESKKGYLFFLIHNNDNEKKFIHRAVGELFLPRIKGKCIVDHIDGNRKNNNLKNLRWLNFQENNLNNPKRRSMELKNN